MITEESPAPRRAAQRERLLDRTDWKVITITALIVGFIGFVGALLGIFTGVWIVK